MPGLFSSVATPEMVKAKKLKGGTDNSIKKRKREDDQAEDTPATDTTAKKVKKRISEETTAVEPTENGSEPPTAKKQKKRKSKDGAENETGQKPTVEDAPTTVVAGEGSVKKKKKKQKPAEEATAESLADEITAKHKSKKDRKKDATEHAPGAIPAQQPDTVPAQTEDKVARAQPTDDLLQTHSPFVQQTTSFYLALSPCTHNFPLEGLCAEHISPLLLTYYPPLKGVLLSYTNPRISEHPDDRQRPQAHTSKEAKVVLSQSMDEYAVTFVWLTAEFLLFRPNKGKWVEGYVNLQNESLLGLVCYNYFNAGIERHRLPKDWRWVKGNDDVEAGAGQKEARGYWVDGRGEKVDGRLLFKVKDFEATPGSDSGGGSMNIIGTLLSEKENRLLDDEERQNGLVRDR